MLMEMLKIINSTIPLKKKKAVVSSADYKLSCLHWLCGFAHGHFVIIHSSTQSLTKIDMLESIRENFPPFLFLNN